MDIEINTELLEFKPGSRMNRAHFALGIIRYDRVDPDATAGLFIYLKPSLTGNEPADVTEYADCHDEFPHEPTADQFFDESQFESYRMLGAHVVEVVFTRAITNPTGEAEHLFERFRSPAPRDHSCIRPDQNRYAQAGVIEPSEERQCGVQASVTSFTAMLALVGLSEIGSSFSWKGSVAAASASVSDLN